MSEEHKIEIFEPIPRTLERRRPALLAPLDVAEAKGTPDLLSYWRTIRERRWTVLSILFAVFTTVLIGTLKQKPIYRATALVEIQKENPNILTVQELFELENVSDTYLETQYKVMRSTSLSRRVIEQLGLDRLAEFNPPRRWWSSSRPAPASQPVIAGQVSAPVDPDATQNTLRYFDDQLSIDPIKRSRLVDVSFESEDSALAAKIVNTLTSNFMDQNLEQRWEATQKASEWLSQQLVGLKAKLEKSEDELQQYSVANGLLFLESEKGTTENIVDDRLRQLQAERTKAQADLFEKESLYRLVQAGDFGSLPGVFDSKLMQDLTLRLSDLESQHAQLATTYSPDSSKLKQIQNQLDESRATLARERERAAGRIKNDYLAAVRRVGLLDQAFQAQQKQANEVAEKSVQYNILKREVDTNKQLYDGLLGRLKEAGVSAGLKASNVRIVDSAAPPRKPARPNFPLNLSLALVVGLGMGIGAAFLQQHLDNTLNSSEDVEQTLQLPALALIPSFESLNPKRGSVYGLHGRKKAPGSDAGTALAPIPRWYRIDSLAPQQSALGEAFRSLRTSVLLSTADQPPRSLLISSPQPGDGKTTVTVNLAISLAQLGHRVLLIDADMRRPCIHRTFQTREEFGLVSYLTGQREWREAVRPTGVHGLDALFCGPVPPAPAELLSSDRMRVLLRQALVDYRFVVVDSPPVLNVADARILATLVEGVVLVVKGGSTPRELAQRARAYTISVGANLIGVVLNNLDANSDGYYYQYYRGYSSAAADEDSDEAKSRKS